jgi:hypothetical protein
MKLKFHIITILILSAFISCTNSQNKQSEQLRQDSIRKADSIAKSIEQQRIIDSVNMVSREQKIIADSIMNQVTN